MISPTNGRIVWYTPPTYSTLIEFPENGGKPLAAIVVHVWHDRMVNLAVFNSNGLLCPKTSVRLLQDSDLADALGGYCEWMPYQIDQAKKNETAHVQPVGDCSGSYGDREQSTLNRG